MTIYKFKILVVKIKNNFDFIILIISIYIRKKI